MTLRERLGTGSSVGAAALRADRNAGIAAKSYLDLKERFHHDILDRIDLERMKGLEPARVRIEIGALVEKMLAEGSVALNERSAPSWCWRSRMRCWDWGRSSRCSPIRPSRTSWSTPIERVYIERRGKLELTPVVFSDDAHLLKIIDKIVSRIGRRIDESSPMVDARLPDGSRVNAIIPPLAIDGPILSIRRFAVNPYTMQDFLEFKSLTPEMAEILEGLAKAKVNLLISGGTGSGKTTLLNIISGNIPPDERIVTIEDAAELQLQQPHVVRLETRPPNIEGRGEVTQRSLVRNALRMRPDRIILGEVRGAEAADMLQAMNTGHEGSMTTIHANSSRDALTRLENMIGMAGMNLPPKASRQQISSALSVVLQIARLTDGRRKVVSLQEITGMEGDIITMQEIFAFRQTGISDNGAVVGHFCATGVRPRFTERLRVYGIELADRLFDPTRHYE